MGRPSQHPVSGPWTQRCSQPSFMRWLHAAPSPALPKGLTFPAVWGSLVPRVKGHPRLMVSIPKEATHQVEQPHSHQQQEQRYTPCSLKHSRVGRKVPGLKTNKQAKKPKQKQAASLKTNYSRGMRLPVRAASAGSSLVRGWGGLWSGVAGRVGSRLLPHAFCVSCNSPFLPPLGCLFRPKRNSCRGHMLTHSLQPLPPDSTRPRQMGCPRAQLCPQETCSGLCLPSPSLPHLLYFT